MTGDDFFGVPPDPHKLMFWSSVGVLAFLVLWKVLY